MPTTKKNSRSNRKPRSKTKKLPNVIDHPPTLEINCVYAGQAYSGGAVVEQPPGSGKTKTCNDNTGRWD